LRGGLRNLATDKIIQRHSIFHTQRWRFKPFVAEDVHIENLFSGCADGLADPPAMDNLNSPTLSAECGAIPKELFPTSGSSSVYSAIHLKDALKVTLEFIAVINPCANKERLHAVPLPVIADVQKPSPRIERHIRTIESHKGRF
jgi:hypothetical protein